MKALLLEKIDETATHILQECGYAVDTIPRALDESELIQTLSSGAYSLVGIRSRTVISDAVIRAQTGVLAIGAFCIGTNQIDLRAAAQAGIPVFNAPYSNTRSVVELTIGTIIMLFRRTFDKSVALHAGRWEKSAAGLHEIRGKTLGIVGYGNIGSQLSVLAEALGMRVLFYDRSEKLALGNAQRAPSLGSLLAQSDVVTLHIDGRPENKGFFGEREFAQMKRGSFFINASRGFVADLSALARYLSQGTLAGAAIDVFPEEPASNDEIFSSPLQGLPNVILTPHVAGSTEEAQQSIGSFVSQRMHRYMATGDTEMAVNFPTIMTSAIDSSRFRIAHIHKNVPGMLAHINQILAARGANIESQMLKTTEEIGYALLETNTPLPSVVMKQLRSIPHTIACRTVGVMK